MLPGLDTPGYLGLISGSMFSGKTSKLIELYKQYTLCGIPVAVINHAADNRYSTTVMSTHDGRTIPCIRAEELVGLEKDPVVAKSRVVLINEGQFFPDIVEWVKALVDVEEKIVFVCGLDGDYTRKSFGKWLDLIPLCDEVTKLTSLCMTCKRHPGIFSHRLSGDTGQILIGADQYIPVCRRCYNSTASEDARARLEKNLTELATLQVQCLELPRKDRATLKAKCVSLDAAIQREHAQYMDLRKRG